MSWDALWYSSYTETGPPRCKRLSRQPMQYQWEAAIGLAVAFSQGRAGWTQITVTRTREEYWYWGGSDSPTGWWMIPPRIARRARALYEAAIECECHRGHGGARSEDIARRLRVWHRTGQWRHVAATISPRHPGPPTVREARRSGICRIPPKRVKRGERIAAKRSDL